MADMERRGWDRAHCSLVGPFRRSTRTFTDMTCRQDEETTASVRRNFDDLQEFITAQMNLLQHHYCMVVHLTNEC